MLTIAITWYLWNNLGNCNSPQNGNYNLLVQIKILNLFYIHVRYIYIYIYISKFLLVLDCCNQTFAEMKYERSSTKVPHFVPIRQAKWPPEAIQVLDTSTKNLLLCKCKELKELKFGFKRFKQVLEVFSSLNFGYLISQYSFL